MSEHICTVCFLPANDHDELCVQCGRGHFPALCCPGCDCESFEKAHEGIRDDNQGG